MIIAFIFVMLLAMEWCQYTINFKVVYADIPVYHRRHADVSNDFMTFIFILDLDSLFYNDTANFCVWFNHRGSSLYSKFLFTLMGIKFVQGSFRNVGF